MSEARIIKAVNATNLEFSGIEQTGTPGRIYTNQTRRFPVKSKKGTKYIFVT